MAGHHCPEDDGANVLHDFDAVEVPDAAGDPSALSVVHVLLAVGGSARWKELRGHVGWRAIKSARAAGDIGRVGSFYFVRDTDLGRVEAGRLCGVRSHLTAAVHHGLAVPPEPEALHITVRRRAHRGEHEGVTLFYRDVTASEVVGDVTTPLRTVVDCLRDGTLRLALSVGDSALRMGIVSRGQLDAAVLDLRGPGSRRAAERLTCLDARAANAFESCTRAILIQAGITGFVPQVTVRHAGFFVGRVDLGDLRRRIVIECDGFDYHSDRAAFGRDLVRFTMLVAGGWHPLRFTWEQVMFREAWVLARVQDVVAQAEPGALREDKRRARARRAAA